MLFGISESKETERKKKAPRPGDSESLRGNLNVNQFNEVVSLV
jgi:hypothetical protein